MSTLRGHDKDKHKEKEKELDKEKDDHHTPQTEAPTLLSARRKEEGGTLHDLKAILVQLRGIKQVPSLRAAIPPLLISFMIILIARYSCTDRR